MFIVHAPESARRVLTLIIFIHPMRVIHARTRRVRARPRTRAPP